MAKRILTEQAADLGAFGKLSAGGQSFPFMPAAQLVHVYIKLDFKSQYENARSGDDAKGFLRSVARAGMAAHRLAERFSGALAELQGSTLHVVLPRTKADSCDPASEFLTELHWTYRTVFNDSGSRVEGWRMTADAGKTLVVAGRGVHGDDSWVSLGKSANRPAKYLYAQLELPEEKRTLRRFHAAIRDSRSDRWLVQDLEASKSRLTEAKSIAEEARDAEPTLDFQRAVPVGRVTAQAAPIGPAGTPASPSTDQPHTYFGWVMRADLDGFTARIEACFDNDQKLQELATSFYSIMETAAQFVVRHRETLAQLPWAGDNFTAAAVFDGKGAYDQAIPRRLIELSLDFEKEMAESAADGGFGGWAHGIAGGTVQGNAAGNVYLGGVIVRGRRFLVGAGEGFGRSAQAFGDINPKAKEMVVYEPDWERLDAGYKSAFEPAVTYRGAQSSLYRKAATEGLVRARSKHATTGTSTRVSVAAGQSVYVANRPHSR